MVYMPSLRSKAAHLVTDLTTVLLNPISDEPSKPHGEERVRSPEEDLTESDADAPDGPDTSSFTAFLVSLLSSSESGDHHRSHPAEESNNPGVDAASGSGMKENSARKGLLARGKHTLGRAFQKASRLGRYRSSSLPKVDSDTINDPSLLGQELKPIKTSKESTSKCTLPVISEPSMLLSENMRSNLYLSLPALVHGRNWVLLYSTWRHGMSLQTLYRRSLLCPGYSLLVVGDRKGATFGGLVEAPLQPTNRKYQGTNNCFVFTSLPSHLSIFRPTGLNHYFTLCSTDFLAMGGGGHFALYLDGDLLNGSSSASETFGNSCLAHSQDFEIKEVELWGFVYASKYEETLAMCRTEKPGICRW
ncbi:putative TLDc domain-containing protein [Dioscorea sansibarensis]